MSFTNEDLTRALNATPSHCSKCGAEGAVHSWKEGACNTPMDRLELIPDCPEGWMDFYGWPDWNQAFKAWDRAMEDYSIQLGEGDDLMPGLDETGVKEMLEDCIATDVRLLNAGQMTVIVGSRGADPGPEVQYWIDENDELQVVEFLR